MMGPEKADAERVASRRFDGLETRGETIFFSRGNRWRNVIYGYAKHDTRLLETTPACLT